MKRLCTIEDCDVLGDGAKLEWIAKAAIDSDGSDNRHSDPCWQPQTTLSHNGRPVDAESVPYIVVPPAIVRGVVGVVMGCKAVVTNTMTGQQTRAVVADIGPKTKLGEMSCECARRIGLSGNPNHGGTSRKIIKYEIWPGVPACVDGVTYRLQSAKA